ncbi:MULTISPECIES: NUDIX domain-containing protein [Acinetobacter]|uniref:ADP-ribose pyrophosphatase n=1 Tax=Acinetobacter amyesii TaxID=2942470 RepID=A0A1T1H515_9GAMM|nr:MULTISPECIES: NUDIX domain-containing protein [Acinetobacter]MCL6247051.1 NUDIX domain-containing protein [Acinetobacter amyesii]OOV84936.1 NUDIX hydrolase [Acinetobacter amyesii]
MNIIKQATYNKKDYSIEGREHLYKGFIQVEKVLLRHRLFHQDSMIPTIQRELIHRPEAAGVLIYSHQQQKFALIEQFRIGAIDDETSPWQLEIIAGVLDGDESAESCIRRESLEESGCELDALQHLFSFYPSAGACAELFHLYSAEAELPEHGGVFGMPDEGENIQLHILDYADIPELLTNGRLKNAPVIMALQWLQQQIHTTRNV